MTRLNQSSRTSVLKAGQVEQVGSEEISGVGRIGRLINRKIYQGRVFVDVNEACSCSGIGNCAIPVSLIVIIN